MGVEVSIISPEDSILSKLHWSRLGESERQFRDALGVAVTQWGALDMGYLTKWAKILELDDYFQRLLQEVSERWKKK